MNDLKALGLKPAENCTHSKFKAILNPFPRFGSIFVLKYFILKYFFVICIKKGEKAIILDLPNG